MYQLGLGSIAVFGLIVVICNILCLLQREISFRRGEDYTHCGHNIVYVIEFLPMLKATI